MKPLLVGECNPYQSNEEDAMRFAFHPDPPHASGGRLCHVILGLTERDYLRHFDRTDLCWPTWSLPKARELAREIVAVRNANDTVIVFGVNVARAFGLDRKPFTVYAGTPYTASPTIIYLPHPSGLNRVWQQAGVVNKTRRLLRALGVPCAEPEVAQ